MAPHLVNKFPAIYGIQKFIAVVYKSTAIIPVLSQINSMRSWCSGYTTDWAVQGSNPGRRKKLSLLEKARTGSGLPIE
jgi:hypothetical protein